MATPRPSDPTPGRDDPHRMPRWVIGFIVAAIAAVMLGVLVLVLGSGDHGPSRHLPGGDQSTFQAPEAHTVPVGHG